MTRAIEGMRDDFCVPIANEPSIKLQLLRPARRGRFGMQNRDQFVGGDVHRAAPRPCELDGITNPAMKLGRNCSPPDHSAVVISRYGMRPVANSAYSAAVSHDRSLALRLTRARREPQLSFRPGPGRSP